MGLVPDLPGRVIRIFNGNTIEVLHNHHPEHIRLNDIDCPEKGKAYGQRAKQAVSGLAPRLRQRSHLPDLRP
jgi:endonuclease YncB( thermonuclease family)